MRLQSFLTLEPVGVSSDARKGFSIVRNHVEQNNQRLLEDPVFVHVVQFTLKLISELRFYQEMLLISLPARFDLEVSTKTRVRLDGEIMCLSSRKLEDLIVSQIKRDSIKVIRAVQVDLNINSVFISGCNHHLATENLQLVFRQVCLVFWPDGFELKSLNCLEIVAIEAYLKDLLVQFLGFVVEDRGAWEHLG